MNPSEYVWRCTDCGEETPAALGAESTDDVECDECGESCELVERDAEDEDSGEADDAFDVSDE